MAGFVYFLPNGNSESVSESKLAPLLGAVVDGAHFSKCECYSFGEVSPSLSGITFTISPTEGAGGEEAHCGYYPDKQTWVKAELPGKPDYWIGWETERPPRPQDLAKPKAKGFPVDVAGAEWLIPAVYAPTASVSKSYRVNRSGFALDIGKQFRDLSERSSQFFDWRFSGANSPSWEVAINYAVDVLAINYRVGLVECSGDVLDIVTRDSMLDIVDESLGQSVLLQELESKKKAGLAPAG